MDIFVFIVAKLEKLFVNNPLVGKWKNIIKSKRKELLSWRDKTFFAFGPAELEAALRGLGLGAGDVVFVHSSFDAFRGFTGKPSDVIETLQRIVGGQGVIMMPTMAFGGTALDYALKHPVTDLRRLPSRMGLVTEIFRRLPGIVRSVHPTHPIALWGKDAQALAAGHHLARTPCGSPSPLHALLGRGGKILLLGANFNVLTFYHTLEEVLEDRLPVKPFTEQTLDLVVVDMEGREWACQTRLYDPSVSRRRDLGRLLDELRRLGLWHGRKVGGLAVGLVSAQDVLRAVESLLARGVACYE